MFRLHIGPLARVATYSMLEVNTPYLNHASLRRNLLPVETLCQLKLVLCRVSLCGKKSFSELCWPSVGRRGLLCMIWWHVLCDLEGLLWRAPRSGSAGRPGATAEGGALGDTDDTDASMISWTHLRAVPGNLSRISASGRPL